ncbi:MAG: hypothetical protein HY860_04235, partial [Chlamydiales bacterium]|nr:hypothetical protein [Chlamydiales bacterium]
MIKKWLQHFLPNPFDRLLKQAKKKQQYRFLILWNRGLGDIPLGLYALNIRIKTMIPDAKITYLTRSDLISGFKMLPQIDVMVDPQMKRGEKVDIAHTLKRLEHSIKNFDIILEKPDPTNWVSWQLGKVVPKLQFQPSWDDLGKKFALVGRGYIGTHVDTETGQYYGYEKNWPKKYWIELFKQLDKPIILFGMKKDEYFHFPNIIDLRGETSLEEMLCIIKNHCCDLIVPDSGILSMAYYVDEQFP